MSIEEQIADEIADRLEFLSTQGVVEFSYLIDLDTGDVVDVSGTVEYETEYLEDCNYLYNSFVSVQIMSLEGVKADERKVAKHLTKKLYG